MMTYTALIVDDEQKACAVLHSLIDEFIDEISNVYCAKSVDEALDLIESKSPDILFLDINMPSKNGFDLLDELIDFEGRIVFTTAHEEHAVRAFKYSAFDYLLKPISIADLQQTVGRMTVTKSDLSLKDLASLINSSVNTGARKNALAIQDKGGMIFIKPAEIVYLKGEGNYTIIQCHDRAYTSSKTIRNFEELLDPEIFLRSHKSYMVNLNFIERFCQNDGGELILVNNHRVPVSRRKRHVLNQFSV